MLPQTCLLTFHGIGAPIAPLQPGEEQYFVGEDVFSKALDLLPVLEKAHGVTIELSFDDGNASDYRTGFPGLIAAGRTGAFFVLAGRLDQDGYLTRRQVREMHDHGMEIGTHGWDHVDWRTLDAAARQREFVDARKALEDVTGAPVTKAAVPFGRFDAGVLRSLKAENYAKVFTSTSGLAYRAAWFQPRWSPTRAFDPARDLPRRLALSQKIKAAVFAALRPVRYRYGAL
ncbi:hypothetical protein GCM10011316_20720 [Roseibium aquae]|uniref:Chitooligosaccharide deacetylase n=1 Tax=Roseibium aquae TaxID=1323746 RepID=A0A916TK20_9HYPH|nr:polysaccharide deacetylase family protein [Roseibium aquae]GGB48445.1 hypothetical protein GCM10011316_20720 [Roseibium aquae]